MVNFLCCSRSHLRSHVGAIDQEPVAVHRMGSGWLSPCPSSQEKSHRVPYAYAPCVWEQLTLAFAGATTSSESHCTTEIKQADAWTRRTPSVTVEVDSGVGGKKKKTKGPSMCRLTVLTLVSVETLKALALVAVDRLHTLPVDAGVLFTGSW